MKLKIAATQRFLHVPSHFEIYDQCGPAIAATTRAVELLAAPPRSACVVSGAGATSAIARGYVQGLAAQDIGATHFELKAGTFEELERLRTRLPKATNCLVAVGGGSVIDVCKALSVECELPVVVVPTALSSDCIGSPISVLLDRKGRKVSAGSTTPGMVIVDTSTTRAAPAMTALAGFCDVLSNASALLDAQDALESDGHSTDNFAITLSECAYRLLLPVNWNEFHQPPGHARLVKALILSGLAMGFAGSSTPCSGAEHSISHAIDFLGEGGSSHGLQVGVATLYCHHLRIEVGARPLPTAVASALRELAPSLNPALLGLDRAAFLRAVKEAPAIRPDRTTILNRVKDPQSFARAFDAAFN